MYPNTWSQKTTKSHVLVAQKPCRKWKDDFINHCYTLKYPRRINSTTTNGKVISEASKRLSLCAETACSFQSPCGLFSSAGVPWSAGCGQQWAPGDSQWGKAETILNVHSSMLPWQWLTVIRGCIKGDLRTPKQSIWILLGMHVVES